VYQKVAQRADAVICVSSFIRDQFLRQVIYPAEQVYVVPNGVDLERFWPGDKRASRARLGIPANETVVLFAGQVSEEKGLLHLVRACRRLVPHHNFRLLVAGSSSLWGGVEDLEEQTPYERQIAEETAGLKATFLGKVAHAKMPMVYQATDIFVCPSVWDEPFGMVNLEAMATGLPIVATRAGGIPEVIVDGVTGLLVPPADADALTGALRGLLDDPLLRRRMGQKGLTRAQEFTWDSIAGRVKEIYEEVGIGW
jgi:glycosyltransferase involved in cell wall biosynthesis